MRACVRDRGRRGRGGGGSERRTGQAPSVAGAMHCADVRVAPHSSSSAHAPRAPISLPPGCLCRSLQWAQRASSPPFSPPSRSLFRRDTNVPPEKSLGWIVKTHHARLVPRLRKMTERGCTRTCMPPRCASIERVSRSSLIVTVTGWIKSDLPGFKRRKTQSQRK